MLQLIDKFWRVDGKLDLQNTLSVSSAELVTKGWSGFRLSENSPRSTAVGSHP